MNQKTTKNPRPFILSDAHVYEPEASTPSPTPKSTSSCCGTSAKVTTQLHTSSCCGSEPSPCC
jgi:hypothetical protein